MGMAERAYGGSRRVVALATIVLVAVAGLLATRAATAGNAANGQWVLGVSNTLVGNGWREEMICAVKAEAKASGKVSKVVVSNINGGAAEQIAGIRNLISAGANAIIINPSDRNALNGVLNEATSRGIVIVAVDQAVSHPKAYIATNDQVAYGRLGAEWLFKQIGGKGNVVEMRGIAGVPADTDRHTGFQQALKKYPGIKVVKQTFTGWQFAPAGKQILDILNSGVKVDGVWTSGIDYTVVNAFKTAGKPLVPVVGADNNLFLKQLRTLYPQFKGAAVTNPATIGGVGASIAIDVLSKKKVKRVTHLTPQVWTMQTAAGKKAITQYYSASRAPTYSSQLFVKPYTHYTEAQLVACK
jgi:ribose transport system substrate-binding protein